MEARKFFLEKFWQCQRCRGMLEDAVYLAVKDDYGCAICGQPLVDFKLITGQQLWDEQWAEIEEWEREQKKKGGLDD